MRNLLRQPLTWMVVAEFIVVATLMLLAWSIVAAASGQHPATGQIQAAESPAVDSTSPTPGLADVPRSTTRPQLPGLNLDAGFWRLRLDQLNRDQVGFEQLEWHIVHSTMDTARHYLETVVLPSITRAERAGGG